MERRSRAGPHDERTTLSLATFLPYRLSVVSARVSEGLARVYGERFGIGIPEWRVLATVGEFRSMTAGAIGRHAHMSKVKVSRAAAALEAGGFLARQPSVRDRREAHLVLTAAGTRLHADIVPLALAYTTKLTAGLTNDERAALDALLDKLTRAAATLDARDARPE